MKKLLNLFVGMFTTIPSMHAFADHSSASNGYPWWIPLLILIGIGLAMILWDEFARSLRAVRNIRH